MHYSREKQGYMYAQKTHTKTEGLQGLGVGGRILRPRTKIEQL